MSKLVKNSIYFDAFIEITKGSNVKYEFDKQLKQIRLDRILFGTNVYPGDYGFIDQTLELDGDPIDVLIFSNHSTFPGCIAKIKIVGCLAMIDDEEVDNKLIAVYEGDPETNCINDLEAVNQHWKNKVWDFFLNYKNLEKKQVNVQRWLNCQEAIQILIGCQKRFQQK